ncbi:MAG: leucine-rich repeat protein [Bacteroidales bacterium]|nr:leucine-rich repeat protein [Bacteroidales bacterium]
MNKKFLFSLSFILASLCLSLSAMSQNFYMAEHTGQSIHYAVDRKNPDCVKIINDFLSNQNYMLLRNSVILSPVAEYQGKTYKVTTISREAFAKAQDLKEITITAGITTIEKNAFADCKKLHTLTLYNLRTIGDKAFAGCTALQSVVIFSSQIPTLGKDVFPIENANMTLYVPDSAVPDYKKSEFSKYFSNILPTSKLGK